MRIGHPLGGLFYGLAGIRYDNGWGYLCRYTVTASRGQERGNQTGEGYSLRSGSCWGA